MKPSIAWLALAAIFLLWSPGGQVLAQERKVPESQAEVMLSFAPVVKQAAPAVVNVFSKRRVVRRSPFSGLFDDPFFNRFFGKNFGGQQRERMESSLGSGVIVDPAGMIVTNHHVIEGSSEIRVVLADRREFAAEVMFSDEATDLAVLSIDTDGAVLPSLELKNSDRVEVGDVVLALGNPFGVGQTVTSGIVSALARTQLQVADFGFFIQTDAAINPGNSGGALVTLDGKLIGINTAIFSRSGGSIGIGFAIPSNMVRTVINAAETGRLLRPWVGLSGQTVSADLAEGLRLDRPGGVIVADIYPEGPADRAGLQARDVVLTYNDLPVVSIGALRFRAATGLPGESAKLGVLRDGEMLDLVLPLEVPPEDPPRAPLLLQGANPLSGAEVASLSPALSEELDLHGRWHGVIITRIRRGSSAHQIGFRANDILDSLNGTVVADSRQLAELLQARTGAREWRIGFTRDGKARNVVLQN